jgi:hypothetical protein
MTHFLEDRVPLVDIWPEEVAVGRYFCERKIHDQTVITLPRASEIDCALERGGSARSHRLHDQGRRDLELDRPLKNSTPAVLAGGLVLGV